MGRSVPISRGRAACWHAWGAVLLLGWGAAAWGQAFPQEIAIELSSGLDLDEVVGQARTRLLQVEALRAAGRWDDAVDTLLQLQASDGDSLVRLSPTRWISLRRYCQMQFSRLPAEALAAYRRRVDPEAERWLQQGLADRAPHLLQRIVETAFASSWGDEAADALAEIALERADPGTARGHWTCLLPAAGEPGDSRLVYPRQTGDAAAGDVPLAEVRAKLVLASLLEGAAERARSEWEAFHREFPAEAGRLAGVSGNLSQRLQSLLSESATWELPAPSGDWLTFAGTPSRTGIAAREVDPAGTLWRVPLPPPPGTDGRSFSTALRIGSPVAESFKQPLSYHPLVLGDLVVVQSADTRIWAWPLTPAGGASAGGNEPAWTVEHNVLLGGEPASQPHLRGAALGVPRYTLTAHGGRLYARVGSFVTGWNPNDGQPREASYLVGIDLATRRVVFGPQRADDGFAFEGPPVCDGRNLYVLLRRSEVRPQLHLAAFDAGSGQLRWRRKVCGGESPARGNFSEVTQVLCTLHDDTVYVNTSLGCIAAVSTQDGHVRWVTAYPRASIGDLSRTSRHFLRDLVPCIYHQGLVLSAPADTPAVLAHDARTGEFLWATQPLEDVVHLLGVAEGHLIASGQRLYWIDLVRQGRISATFPDPGSKEPRGQGRGVLAGGKVYWPTADCQVYVFQQRPDVESAIAIAARPPISLVHRGGAEAPLIQPGNLLVAGGKLILAGHQELVVLDERPVAGQPGGPAGDSPPPGP